MGICTFLEVPNAIGSGVPSNYSERDDKTARWNPSHYFDWRISTLTDRAGDVELSLGSGLSESQINGIKAIKSAGGGAGVTSVNIFPEEEDSGYCIAYAFKRDSTTVASFLAGCPHLQLQAQTDNKLYYYKRGESTQRGAISLSTGVDIIIVNFDPAADTETLYVNGASSASSVITGASSISYVNAPLTLSGASANNIIYGEVLIFGSAKTASEISAINAYLRSQYGS